ncbi:substrate-binding domain-containing protein [Edaphobacillus lindanitolerans]|uniref:Monosaccharide ABC transporter substrate-binding protein, CUT2 family n=1 Tax=Edaphobacillus lindanitolerans TaxID=550447 RepID=A0A1U7PNE9_9BACI|nr:substrate-binding domain-containing protein [Edaphobacillus lindanitolerans]SIT73156.1 monosaccharide ABC transporter substrate-binding protein, CUT2 family [Edaphobacillus lindanitolerans]
MKKWLGFASAVLATSLFAAACGDTEGGGSAEGGKDGEKQLEVGFALKTQDSPYFVSLADKVEKYAKEQGWKVTILDAGGDVQKEAANMETFIAQGKDLIFLDAIEPDAVVPSIDSAAEAGIPVINLDSGVAEEANDVTTVYSDNRQNGRLVGLEYAKKMGDEEIKAIVLSGAKGNVAGYERRTGLFAGIIEGKLGVSEDEAWKLAEEFESALSSKGKATNEEAKFSVVGQGWGNWTEEEGLKAAEDLITANSDLTTALGENDQMLFGAMTALDNAGIKDVDIVAAADGAVDAFDRIKEGGYFATGLNSPTLVAEKGIEIAKEILVDGKDPESYEEVTLTEPAAITKENVEEYYDLGF